MEVDSIKSVLICWFMCVIMSAGIAVSKFISNFTRFLFL